MTLRDNKSRQPADAPPTRHGGDATVLVIDSLVVDVVRGIASRRGRPLNLQPRQFDLLVYLARRVGQVVTRPMIARAVWQDDTATWTNVITVNVCMLRRELERFGLPNILHTVRGEGYRFGESSEPRRNHPRAGRWPHDGAQPADPSGGPCPATERLIRPK